MVSQLELVKQFCSTYDIKYFFKLNKETQKFFKEAAYYLLGLNPNINYDRTSIRRHRNNYIERCQTNYSTNHSANYTV